MKSLKDSVLLPCGVEISNRIAKSAMSENMGTPQCKTSNEILRLYERWVQGSPGLLITGNVMVDHSALGEVANVVIEENHEDPLLKSWGAIQTPKTQIWVQLNHPGKQSPKFLSKSPVAPSPIPLKAPLDKMFNCPRELTQDEIISLIKRFSTSARIVKESGFGGVQIHGAHGYLVSQFLSPRHNQRKDQWGGVLQNRMRFLTSILEEMRGEVGHSFPIGIKLNSADFQRGGFTEEDSLQVIKKLSELKIDLVEISGGSYESHEMMGSGQKKSTIEREAYFLDFAKKARVITTTPLMLTGGFRTKEGMLKAIHEDASDIIGLARSLALNPDFPRELLLSKNTKSLVHPLSTGFKFLDNMVPLEITWYTQQLQRMGNGKNPKPNFSPTLSILNTIYDNGLKGLKRVRAKS